ncbi:hypothetical protein [Cupriavidus plantarum]|uniref:hypothetical protein n=1 Tax=Cupriavidus plantarum TaxID=942865 RepID=UPI001BAB7E5D|nr:hypothetical protein [Cupriavidus plantarum]
MFTLELDRRRARGDASGDNEVRPRLVSLDARKAVVEKMQAGIKKSIDGYRNWRRLADPYREIAGWAAQLSDSKKQRLAPQSEIQISSNAARDEQASLDMLSQRIEQLESKKTGLHESCGCDSRC